MDQFSLITIDTILVVFTTLATCSILFGFGRIVFSIGEHKEQTKTIPVITFMVVGNLFLNGFILFSIYHTVDNLSVCKAITFLMVLLFELLIMIDVFLLNRIMLFIDRYLFCKRHKVFPRYWRSAYALFRKNNKIILYWKRMLQGVLGGLIVMSFLPLDMVGLSGVDTTLYSMLYLMYFMMFIITKNYFNSISNDE